VLLKQHKTARLKGILEKQLPPSVRAILEASLKSLPRSTLFVSDLTRQPYNSEASFSPGRVGPSTAFLGSTSP
jgi:hypothetical protein